uniref:F-actin-capping protein subunit beta n=1 Tax=Halisarca dujardinii TaxID=2583056 RepID=A0A9F1UCU7_HALDU|nr:CAPZB [Halisarca dujardinii]
MAAERQLDCALDLMRRLPPQNIEKNLSDLIDLVPSLCEDLLSSVDQPLKVTKCKETGKDYLLCDYNRDGDSYRSPWTNKYDPPLSDGAVPSDRLRKLELDANNAFDTYREMYFESGICSVYLWDLEHGFAGVILIKKAGDTERIKGCWDSIHVVEVQEKGRSAHYKLTSTVMLWLQTIKEGSGTMNIGGSLTRQVESDSPVTDSSPHISNIGRMIEDMENRMRTSLNEIYFGKTRDVVNDVRSVVGLQDKGAQDNLIKQLNQKIGNR